MISPSAVSALTTTLATASAPRLTPPRRSDRSAFVNGGTGRPRQARGPPPRAPGGSTAMRHRSAAVSWAASVDQARPPAINRSATPAKVRRGISPGSDASFSASPETRTAAARSSGLRSRTWTAAQGPGPGSRRAWAVAASRARTSRPVRQASIAARVASSPAAAMASISGVGARSSRAWPASSPEKPRAMASAMDASSAPARRAAWAARASAGLPAGSAQAAGSPSQRRTASEMALSRRARVSADRSDRKSTRLNSSHLGISYAVFCLKKKKLK